MNLETFKARARRKLQLPYNSGPTASDPSRGKEVEDKRRQAQATEPKRNDQTNRPLELHPDRTPDSPQATAPQDTLSPGDQPAGQTAPANRGAPAAASSDKFASALTYAQREQATAAPASQAALPTEIDPRSERRTPTSLQSLTGSPAQTEPQRENSDDEQFQHLRSLLLGNSYENQQDQVDVVYQRTKAGINALRRDMDARLTDLTEYVEQLEQSILNSMESHARTAAEGELGADAAERLNQQDQRLEALDARLTNTLDTLRDELDDHRQADRRFLRQELATVNVRTDELLTNVGHQLESSINGIQSNLSTQLSDRSTSLQADTASETTINSLRERLGELIDDRIETFNAEQSKGLGQLRDTLLANTDAIKMELRTQTEAQRNTLAGHRTELERQFNAAIATLNTSKVSHKELSQLLSRLADRLQQL